MFDGLTAFYNNKFSIPKARKELSELFSQKNGIVRRINKLDVANDRINEQFEFNKSLVDESDFGKFVSERNEERKSTQERTYLRDLAFLSKQMTDKKIKIDEAASKLVEILVSQQKLTYEEYIVLNHVGFEREDMPQIDDLHSFLTQISQEFQVTKKQVALKDLKPCQVSVNKAKVLGMLGDLANMDSRELLVSSEGYIVDGHHWWGMMLEVDPEKMITVYQTNASIFDTIQFCNESSHTVQRSLNDKIVKGMVAENYGVAVWLKNSQDQFLLMKRGKSAPWAGGKYFLPSETVDQKSESADTAAKRCLKEECGIVVDKDLFQLIGIVDQLKGWITYTVVIHIDSPEIKISREHDDYEWITLDQFQEYQQVSAKELKYHYTLAKKYYETLKTFSVGLEKAENEGIVRLINDDSQKIHLKDLAVKELERRHG